MHVKESGQRPCQLQQARGAVTFHSSFKDPAYLVRDPRRDCHPRCSSEVATKRLDKRPSVTVQTSKTKAGTAAGPLRTMAVLRATRSKQRESSFFLTESQIPVRRVEWTPNAKDPIRQWCKGFCVLTCRRSLEGGQEPASLRALLWPAQIREAERRGPWSAAAADLKPPRGLELSFHQALAQTELSPTADAFELKDLHSLAPLGFATLAAPT